MICRLILCVRAIAHGINMHGNAERPLDFLNCLHPSLTTGPMTRSLLTHRPPTTHKSGLTHHIAAHIPHNMTREAPHPPGTVRAQRAWHHARQHDRTKVARTALLRLPLDRHIARQRRCCCGCVCIPHDAGEEARGAAWLLHADLAVEVAGDLLHIVSHQDVLRVREEVFVVTSCRSCLQ